MANHIYVFCRSSEAIEYRELAERMAFSYFEDDDEVSLSPKSEGEQATRTDWSEFELTWSPNHRPLLVQRYTSDDESFAELINEAKMNLDGLEKSAELSARLDATKQIFHFEFVDLSDEAWEMVDDMEIYLAGRLDGAIEAAEGFYAGDLSPLVLWPTDEERQANANAVLVHCRSSDSIVYGEIAALLAKSYSAGTLELNPTADGADASSTDWKAFDIFWARGKQPINITRETDPRAVVKESVAELADLHQRDASTVIEHLNATKQIIQIQFYEISDEAFEMLDELEVLFATRLDGIIQAAEGYYDKSLKTQLVAWPDEG